MARPARYNADYYTHTASLRNDRKVKAIRTKFGAAGYGLFHMLLEALTDADHTALDTSPLELELLAGDFGVEASDIEALLKFGESVGYFGRNDTGLLTCPELSKWLEPVFEKRNRSKNPPAAALLSQSAAETGVSVTETPQSKVKESKGEKSKEETTSSLRSEVGAPQKKIEVVEVVEPLPESPPAASTPGGAADVGTSKPAPPAKVEKPARFVPPTSDEILAYMLSQRPHNPPAEVQRVSDKCFGYYSGNGWKVGRNPMKDWKGACQTFLADLPKLAAGQAPVVVPQPYYNGAIGQRSSQISTRAAAIAGADAMFDAVAAGQDPFANKFP